MIKKCAACAQIREICNCHEKFTALQFVAQCLRLIYFAPSIFSSTSSSLIVCELLICSEQQQRQGGTEKVVAQDGDEEKTLIVKHIHRLQVSTSDRPTCVFCYQSLHYTGVVERWIEIPRLRHPGRYPQKLGGFFCGGRVSKNG